MELRAKVLAALRPGKAGPRQLRLTAAVCVTAMILSLATAGCWGKREIEERSFIQVMAVDKGIKERLRVTAMIAVPRTATGQTGGEKTHIPLTISSEGWDVTDALNRIEATSSRELTGIHISCLLLGEEFAKEDIRLIIDIFTRSIEFRPNTMVAVCKGSAESFLRELKAPEESQVSEYLTKLISVTYESLGFCPLVTMQDFSVRYQTSEVSPWAAYLALAAPVAAPKTEPAEPSPPAGTEGKAPELVPAAVAGTALFALNGDKYQMVGLLDPEETRAALLLAGQAKTGFLDFQHPGDLEVLTFIMRHASVRTSVRRQGDSVAAKFVIRIGGTVEEFVVNPMAPPMTNELRIAGAQTAEQRIEQLCSQAFAKMMALGCDAIALGRSVHGTFLTVPEWEAFDWASKMRNATATFDVRVDIYSTGFSFQRAYPR